MHVNQILMLYTLNLHNADVNYSTIKLEEKIKHSQSTFTDNISQQLNEVENILGEEPRWRRSRTGRTLSPPQIHQKSI